MLPPCLFLLGKNLPLRQIKCRRDILNAIVFTNPIVFTDDDFICVGKQCRKCVSPTLLSILLGVLVIGRNVVVGKMPIPVPRNTLHPTTAERASPFQSRTRIVSKRKIWLRSFWGTLLR